MNTFAHFNHISRRLVYLDNVTTKQLVCVCLLLHGECQLFAARTLELVGRLDVGQKAEAQYQHEGQQRGHKDARQDWRRREADTVERIAELSFVIE